MIGRSFRMFGRSFRFRFRALGFATVRPVLFHPFGHGPAGRGRHPPPPPSSRLAVTRSRPPPPTAAKKIRKRPPDGGLLALRLVEPGLRAKAREALQFFSIQIGHMTSDACVETPQTGQIGQSIGSFILDWAV